MSKGQEQIAETKEEQKPAVDTGAVAEVKGEEEEEEEEEEIEVAEERTYTIPLRQAWEGPRGFRAPKAVRLVKNFVKRHMKPKEEIVMGEEVNEALWSHGIKKPPRRIRVRVVKDKKGKVYIYPVK